MECRGRIAWFDSKRKKKRRLSPDEFNVYQLAENLHCPVAQVYALPSSELEGWFLFYAEKSRRERAGKGDLVSLFDSENQDEITEGLKSMGFVE